MKENETAQTEKNIIRREVEKASSLIAVATQMAGQGRLVGISALKKHVSSICETADRLKKADCGDICESMTALLGRMDDFDRVMRDSFSYLTAQTEKENEK